MSEEIKEWFPDGTPIDKWFYEFDTPTLADLGKQYILTDYNIFDDGKVYTKEIQKVIDLAAQEGGGVLVVPAGTYLTGSLYFKQGVHLYITEGGTLKGSDDISDYDIVETRIEGETCLYFAALINADGVDNFKICGFGTIDGNGLRSWKAFWLRRKWNPNCTNKDEQRPRLIYLSNCKNVWIANLKLQNSHFWTTHIYRCNYVKYINCRIFSPAGCINAPSTDAIDIDVCTDVLIKGCYMEVNDDAVCLKGGKGPWADSQLENGMNERILVEDCIYGFCHSCVTCDSESVHNRNILVRRVQIKDSLSFLSLKMRPDTPQHYEYISIEQAKGTMQNFININPWTQFYDLKDREDIPLSYANHITIRDCICECDTYLNITPNEEQYQLSEFTLKRLQITTKKIGASYDVIKKAEVKDVIVKEV